VAVGGEDAALALYEARGNMARARPLLSQSRPDRARAPAASGGTAKSSNKAAVMADEATRPASNKARRAGADIVSGGLASLVAKRWATAPRCAA